MNASRATAIQWALVGGAIAQCLLYVALWRFLATSQPVTPDTSDLKGTAYKIVTADGESHLLAVDSPDPAQVLVEASQRFEHVASIERLDPAQAMAALQNQRRNHLWVLGLFVFPVSFLLVATRLRTRDRGLTQVLDAIAPTLTVDVTTLERATGLSPRQLRKEITRLRQFGLDELQWDQERGRVYDSRLSAYNLTLQFCPHCHDPIHVRVRADLASAPRCPNCMTTMDTSVLASMNQGLVERLLADSAARARPPAFSFAAFALWTLVLPPAALALAWRASG